MAVWTVVLPKWRTCVTEKCHATLFLIKKIKSVYLENLKITKRIFIVMKWSTTNNFYFGCTHVFL
jgi:hypothetical protein